MTRFMIKYKNRLTLYPKKSIVLTRAAGFWTTLEMMMEFHLCIYQTAKANQHSYLISLTSLIFWLYNNSVPFGLLFLFHIPGRGLSLLPGR